MLFPVGTLLFTIFLFSTATTNKTEHKTDDGYDNLNGKVYGGVCSEHDCHAKFDILHQKGKYLDKEYGGSCLFQTKERNVKLISSFHDWKFADKQLLAGS